MIFSLKAEDDAPLVVAFAAMPTVWLNLPLFVPRQVLYGIGVFQPPRDWRCTQAHQ